MRWDANTSASGQALWPRAVVSYDLRPNSTKLTAGIGVFADKPLLSPLVFAQRQARLETLYDPSGQAVVSSRLFTNRLAGPLAIPRATTWNVQLDQTLRGGWMVRAAVQQRLGRHEWTVNQVVLDDTSGELRLTGDGESSARSLEVTTGYRSAHGKRQFYLSYVRARTEGDLNDLNTVAGNRSPAQVLPNERGPAGHRHPAPVPGLGRHLAALAGDRVAVPRDPLRLPLHADRRELERRRRAPRRAVPDLHLAGRGGREGACSCRSGFRRASA